uniref:Uncharacterized protein n=1 Tax=Anopheles albimanus TaxID=7167 RepID=A0A182FZ13_ANOAL
MVTNREDKMEQHFLPCERATVAPLLLMAAPANTSAVSAAAATVIRSDDDDWRQKVVT